MRRFLLAALAAASLCTPASAAGKPKTLEELFAPLFQGACVTIDAVRTVGVTTQLTSEQFSSCARSGWDSPGDPRATARRQAFLAKDSNGVAILGLFDDGGQVCAVFQATDWIERVVDQVGRGETGKLGQAM